MNTSRRGFILMEAFIACGLLAVVVVVAIQMLAAGGTARRAAERREIALQEAANAVERASALGYDRLNDERLAQIKLSPAVEAMLPDAKLTFSSESSTEEPVSRHVTVEVSWASPSGGREPPVRLDFWTFASPAQKLAGASP